MSVAVEFIRALRDGRVQEIFEPNLLPRGVTLEISLGAFLELRKVERQDVGAILAHAEADMPAKISKGMLVIGIPAKPVSFQLLQVGQHVTLQRVRCRVVVLLALRPRVSDFLAALSGDRSGLKMRLASPPLKLAFDGTVANRTSALMEGTLTVDSPSLRNALRWTGQPQPGSGGFGRFALKARANVVGGSVALTNVNVELDGNVAEGVMTFNNSGRQTLQATLDAGALDFTQYISTFRLLARGQRDWNRQLFDLNTLSTADLAAIAGRRQR